MVAAEATGERDGDDWPRGRWRPLSWALAALGLVLLLVLLIGGYGFGWRWTGLAGSVTLWDWLQVIALPLALGIAPILLRYRSRLTRRHRGVIGGLLLLFAVLVLAGYLMPWEWTGFTGNTLWDWLELALLPLVVGTASLWAERDRIRRPHLLVAGILSTLFLVLVICGYLVPWRWTGFRGNTAWDWIKLLLLPIIVPTVLAPAVLGRVTGMMADPPDQPEPEPVASQPVPPVTVTAPPAPSAGQPLGS